MWSGKQDLVEKQATIMVPEEREEKIVLVVTGTLPEIMARGVLTEMLPPVVREEIVPKAPGGLLPEIITTTTQENNFLIITKRTSLEVFFVIT